MRGHSDLVEERDRLVAALSDVVHTFDEYSDVLVDCPGVQPIREIATELKATSDELLEEGRLLNLGIVGQIKAGKSTLLNLLLFDGREVLPSAATPMTASLTHIVRSDEIGTDQADVDVEYYSPDEWQEIKAHAREYLKAREAGRSPDEFLTACHQLVEMAEKRGIDITDHQDGATRSVSIDNLNGLLRSVVGAEGELTPLVKSVTIRCGQGVPNLDIVDTPGLNDPIVSRVRATQKLLERCDAVLLLSYAGQFMDSPDVELLQHTLPREGIKRCLVIGSKFDSALVDVAREHRRDLQAAIEAVEGQLTGRFQREAERMRDEDGYIPLTRDDVLFMSPMCTILGTEPCSQWNPAERGAFDTLRRAYPDWLDSPENGTLNEDTARNLVDVIGRREAVDAAIREIRRDRDKIVLSKVRAFLHRKRQHVVTEIEALIDALNDDQESLSAGSLEKLNHRKRRVYDTIGNISDNIVDKWGPLVDEQNAGIRATDKDCGEDIRNARNVIKESVSIEQRRLQVKKGAGFLGLGWLFRSIVGAAQYETVTYEKTVLDRHSLRLSLDNASDKLRSSIHGELDKLFDQDFVRRAKETLRGAVGDVLDKDTASVIGGSIRRSLDNAVEKIASRARADVAKYRSRVIGRRFEVHRDSVHGNLSEARSYLNKIGGEVTKRIDGARAIVQDAIDKAKPELVPVATRDLEMHHERLGRDIADGEFKLQRYEQACGKLRRQGDDLAQTDRVA